jgi:hypothetical protein
MVCIPEKTKLHKIFQLGWGYNRYVLFWRNFMLNQNPRNPHSEIKLPELSPIANTKVVSAATSEDLVNQATKENLSEPVQKISITDYLEENSKLLSAFWICFSLAALLSKNMNIDDFGVQLAMFFPALILLWETYATFPRTKNISVSLYLFYISMVSLSVYLYMYLSWPLESLIPKSLMIRLIIFLVFAISVVLYFILSIKSLKLDTFKNKTPQPEK